MALFLVFGEGFPKLSELLEQRRGFPKFALLLLKFENAVVDFFQANSIGIPHRAATIGGETVAVDINDIDIHGAKCGAVFEDAGAFVHQRVDTAIDNLLPRNCSLTDAVFRGPLFHQGGDLGIERRLAVFIVFIPASPGLLAEAPHFAEPVSGKGLAHARLFEMTMLLANAPTDVET